MKVKSAYFLICMSFLFMPMSCAAISLNTLNTFQDGSTQGWLVGAISTLPTTNISTGGPNGVNDRFLRCQSQGGSGAGSKFICFSNRTEWTGNWTDVGVKYIKFWVNNTGNSTLNLRIALDGRGGGYCTSNAKIVNAGSGWVFVALPASAIDFTSVGGTDMNATLSNVTSIRILSSTFPSFTGDAIAAQAGFDNISASNNTSITPVTSIHAHSETTHISPFYPNPSQTGFVYFNLESDNNSEWVISLCDISSKLLKTELLKAKEGNNEVKLDFNAFGNGLFLVKLDNRRGKRFVKRVVILK